MPAENFRERLLQRLGTPRTKDRLAVLFLILLPPVFFWRETLGWLTLGDQDAVFWFFPAYKFAAEQIRSGALPLWNPYQYGGLPFFAEWQSGTLDPLNWLYWIATTSRTLTLSLELSFVAGLVAMFSYARSLNFTRRASIFAAVIFALSGFLVGRTLYPGFLHIVALAPLVLCFTERLSQRGRWRDVAFGALIIAWQVFAAHPQPLIYSSLLACAYAIFKFQISDLGSSFKFLLKFSLMFIAGIGLASVQIFPAFEFATKSVRQEWPFELFTLHSLHPASLLVTLFPFFHGSGKTIYHLPYWGVYWHHNEAQIYLGALALALAAAGAIAAWRTRWRTGMFWSVVAIVGTILAMGKYTGFIARMLYHVPLISHFRSPNRHWMEVTMAAALLAGYAVDRLLKEESRYLVRCVQVSSAVIALLCCTVGGFALWQKDRAENLLRSLTDLHQLPQGFLQSAHWEFLLPMIAAVCVCLAVVVFVQARNRARWFTLLLAILIVDLNLYAAFAPINNPAKLEMLIGRAIPLALAARQTEREPTRYQIMLSPATGEFSPFWFYGHEMMPGYDPVLSERQKIFSGLDEAGRCFNQTMLEPQDHTLDIFNVRYVFVPPGYFTAQTFETSSRWRELNERSPAAPYREYRIYENLRALPRVWLASRAKVAYEGDQLKLIRGELDDFDPRTTALVDHETAAKLDQSLMAESPTATSGGNASILSRTPTKLVIEAEAAKPSLLVMSEMFYPGWKAKLDGAEVDPWRVNYNLRGVSVPEGKHLVELIYRPKSLFAGAAVTLATALCLLAVFVLEKRFKGADVSV
ncbi:MAG: YfhO family protein [Acidobacteriota bacterium]